LAAFAIFKLAEVHLFPCGYKKGATD